MNFLCVAHVLGQLNRGQRNALGQFCSKTVDFLIVVEENSYTIGSVRVHDAVQYLPPFVSKVLTFIHYYYIETLVWQFLERFEHHNWQIFVVIVLCHFFKIVQFCEASFLGHVVAQLQKSLDGNGQAVSKL